MVDAIVKELSKQIQKENVDKLQRFFKTKPGEYAEDDVFIGVKVPNQRKVAKKFEKEISLDNLEELLHSPIHEHRLTALFMLVGKYKKAKQLEERQELFSLYNRNTQWCNNWDLVDSSAYFIAGAYAYETGDEILYCMATDDCLWRKRIAMVATLHFIKKGEVAIVFNIAKLLLDHKHDLIHKAIGWMLREAGNVDQSKLYSFIAQHYNSLPRTTLRYAIEKFPYDERLKILRGEFS